jgi:ABC-type multidrug transport system fused ATPase/permease subunit
MKSELKLINSRNKSFIIIFLILNLFLAILETIGIGSLPVIILSLLDQSSVFKDYFFFEIIEFFFDTNSPNFILLFSIAIFLFFLLKNIYYLVIKLFEGLLRKKIVSDISCQLFRNYLELSFEKHQYKNPSIMLRNMTNNCENYSSYITSMSEIVREILIISFLFSLLFIQNKILSTSIFSILLFVIIIFYAFLRNFIYNIGKISEDLRGKQYKLINQSLEAIRYVKILKKENFLLNKFSQNLNKILKQSVVMNLIKSAPKAILELIAISIMLTCVYFFMNYEQSENVVPFITLLGLILIRFIPSFNIISSNFSALKFLTPSKEILVNEFRNKTKINKNYNVKIKKGIKNFNFKSNILFKDVYFKYPNSKELNLKKININIKKNSFVAFIGESGAGKSTIVDLILGLLKPSSGKILIDGNNIQSILSEWYADIGFIPQDIYLDDDTVKNNITFYEENINLNNLKKAIKLSQLEKFIDKLPNKYETYIGNRGVRLSGGQIQRIGIARCLYRNPKIIIMDEATSSLDNQAEKKILNAINNLKKGRTLIAIAHRLSTVRRADLIFFVKNGKVVDYGSYKKLKKTQSDFFTNI